MHGFVTDREVRVRGWVGLRWVEEESGFGVGWEGDGSGGERWGRGVEELEGLRGVGRGEMGGKRWGGVGRGGVNGVGHPDRCEG